MQVRCTDTTIARHRTAPLQEKDKGQQEVTMLEQLVEQLEQVGGTASNFRVCSLPSGGLPKAAAPSSANLAPCLHGDAG